jgi:hypothetical protein
MPPTIPGTAATVSSIIARQPYLLCAHNSPAVLISNDRKFEFSAAPVSSEIDIDAPRR